LDPRLHAMFTRPGILLFFFFHKMAYFSGLETGGGCSLY
jgi:hypothetical protein